VREGELCDTHNAIELGAVPGILDDRRGCTVEADLQTARFLDIERPDVSDPATES
jgi:hypothetical protein